MKMRRLQSEYVMISGEAEDNALACIDLCNCVAFYDGGGADKPPYSHQHQ